MNEMFKIIPRKYQSLAISLAHLGVKDIAWPRGLALEIIAVLKSKNVGILGGDVLRKEGNKYDYETSSWHSDRKNDESWNDYVMRSHEEAKRYLLKFPDAENGLYAYSIVSCNETEYLNLRNKETM